MEKTTLAIILLGVVTLYITQWIRIEVTALLSLTSLVVFGILTPQEALSGFANEATVTVGAMLVLSAGLVRTGVIDYVTDALERAGSLWAAGVPLLVGLLAAAMSAFMNNTPVVVLLIPVVLSLCRRFGMVPSKLLIPLSYFAILGGTTTLIGTSTNILVHSIHQHAGGDGFGMFEFTKMGLCYLAVGTAYLVIFGGRLLPVRTSLAQLLEPKERTSFVTELWLPPSESFQERSIAELFGSASSTRVLQLVRQEEVTFAPPPETPLRGDDTLLVEISADDLSRMTARGDVEFGSAVADDQRVVISRTDVTILEAVVVPGSRFVNQEVRDIGLTRTYGIQVLAVRRMGHHHQYRIRGMRLLVGDVLLIQGDARALHALKESGDALLVEGVEHTMRDHAKVPIAVATMVAVVTLAAFEVLPISILSVAGVAALLLTRCLQVPDAMRALDATVLLLLAGTIPLGLALQKTGMAADVANGVLGFAGAYGPVVLVSAFYLLTSLFTEFLSNNASAVLLAPIALGIAQGASIDPKPLLVAIAFGASASFATPIGYQTNTLVMGPGGYRFRDYLKVGLPLNLILWITASLLIPWFWPL